MPSVPRPAGGSLATLAPGAPARAPRCLIGLRPYRRSFPYAPSAQATAGALDLYLEGRRDGDVRRMLFGLSILHSATTGEVEAAIADRSAVDAESPRDARALFETASL